MYEWNKTEVCDVTVTWDPPKYTRHRNKVANYTLTYWKVPDMNHASYIQPHRGTVYLNGVSNVLCVEYLFFFLYQLKGPQSSKFSIEHGGQTDKPFW